MAVRRLDPEQPSQFAFSAENMAWARQQIAKFPEGRQASAVLPLLWKAQEQEGWLSEPAIRHVSELLGMAHIRGLEIATFYTMFQLSPVGKVAHIQVCGTTPCMLSGSRALIDVCKARIATDPHHVSADGKFSWEEVECMGVCANAPMVQIDKDTFEDLTPAALESILEDFAAGKKPKTGSQIGRTASCPAGGATTLKDPSLYDGSTIGAWKKRFEDTAIKPSVAGAVETSPPSALASPAHKAQIAAGSTPASPTLAPAPVSSSMNTGAMAAMANAGLVKDLETRSSGKALSVDEIEKMKASSVRRVPVSSSTSPAAPPKSSKPGTPELLSAARDGKPDDLGLIWGVGEKLAERLNAMGIWHFDQIAVWTPADVTWFENAMPGFKGRVARDKWIEQCQKLSGGWRPEGKAGERPKG